MGRKMRLELTTSGTTNQRSNQLSYIRHRICVFIRYIFICQGKKIKFYLLFLYLSLIFIMKPHIILILNIFQKGSYIVQRYSIPIYFFSHHQPIFHIVHSAKYAININGKHF